MLILGALLVSGIIISGVFYFTENYILVKKNTNIKPISKSGIGFEPPKNIVNTPPFLGVATSTKFKRKEFINTFPITSFENLSSGLVILKEERTKVKNNYYNNVFFFSVFNLKTKIEQKIGVAQTKPWITKAKLVGDKIYFINNEDKINYFDIETKNTILLEFSENSNINDFLILGNLIFYLKDGCLESMSCVLGLYDSELKQNKIIVDKLETSTVGIVNISEYMPKQNAILLVYAMGDAGVALARLTKVDIKTGKEELLHSVQFEYCGEYGEACTDVQKKRNDVYNAFKKKYLDKINSCDKATIKSAYGKKGRYLSISTKKEEITLNRAWFVGCFKK